MEKDLPDRLMTLGHPQRLAIFRLLMRRYPDRLPAGEIAKALGLKASTLSTYLAALMRVGLVTQERAGTSLLYAIDMGQVQGTFDVLLRDCCRGRPEFCSPNPHFGAKGATPMTVQAPDRTYAILFICTGNSARSIFAETLLREIAGDRFTAYSAGTKPSSDLNPIAVELLRQKGHDIAPLRAKSIAEFSGTDAPDLDFVFTVCNPAANEDCPAWEGQPISGHWGMPDPAQATGTEAEKMLAFQQAYGALKHRIEAFAALPIATLSRISLQSAVDEIGRNPLTLSEDHA